VKFLFYLLSSLQICLAALTSSLSRALLFSSNSGFSLTWLQFFSSFSMVENSQEDLDSTGVVVDSAVIAAGPISVTLGKNTVPGNLGFSLTLKPQSLASYL
jgi:hypothetical protein